MHLLVFDFLFLKGHFKVSCNAQQPAKALKVGSDIGTKSKVVQWKYGINTCAYFMLKKFAKAYEKDNRMKMFFNSTNKLMHMNLSESNKKLMT